MTKFVRISPRKARLVADVIRGLSVEKAMQQLKFSQLKGGKLMQKTLNSAVANAETQLGVRREDLLVCDAHVDAGPIIKRAKSKNRGGRVPIMKRTSHFTVVVASEVEGG